MKNPIVDQIMQMMMGGEKEAATGPVTNPRMQDAQAPQREAMPTDNDYGDVLQMEDDGLYGADHPLWAEAVAIFEEEFGHPPASDSDMEVTMQEILQQLMTSDAGIKQQLPPIEDDPMDAENSVPDNIRQRSYKNNGGGNPDVKSQILQKILGGMK